MNTFAPNYRVMTAANNEHVETARLQNEIREYLGLSDTELIFDFTEQEGNIRLDLITVNPRHNQSFLFHSTIGTDRIDALHKMLDYVKSYREKENSYTIQYKVRGDNELHT